MCDCCSAEGRDASYRCGPQSKMVPARLYKVFVGRVASVKLCRLCDIHLFRSGETRFLAQNIQFAQTLVSSKSSSDGGMGLFD
ncbi:MAG: hypothetical protein VXV96_16100 [Bdellovibrionota bacterium]|jgi:hypothetical protein|nr:hypothetical protein [Bdellovibrionota bacterium]